MKFITRLFKQKCWCGKGRLHGYKTINNGDHLLCWSWCDRCDHKEEGRRYDLIFRADLRDVEFRRTKPSDFVGRV